MGESQPEGQPQPAANYTITNLEALRVISDPLRQRIIESLTNEPRTVKQVAASLGLSLTKIYYHINLLEEHGLIRVVATRQVSNIVEKQYQATAHKFTLDRSLLTFSEGADDAIGSFVSEAVDNMRAQIRASRQTGLIDPARDAPRYRSLIMLVGTSKLSAARADEFYQQVQLLAEQFSEADYEAVSDEAQPYSMMIALYPALPAQPGEAGDETSSPINQEVPDAGNHP